MSKRATEVLTEKQLLAAGHWCRAVVFQRKTSAAWCDDHGLLPSREKASGESVNTAGGVLVPAEIENSIISLRDANGIMRQFASVLNMGSDERSWPRRVNGVTASFASEGAPLTPSQLSFDEVRLAAKKVWGMITVSNEIIEDEVVAFGSWFVEEMSTAFARKEDDCGFVGDGSSTYGGIRGICNLLVDGNHGAGKAGAAAGHTGLDKIDGVDLGALMGLLPSFAWPRARWYTSGFGVGGCFGRLIAAAGGSIGMAPDALNYMGFGISIVPSMPGSGSQVGKICVAFGDLRQAVAFGSRRGVTVRSSPHPNLTNDATLVRGTERFDLVAANLGDNTNAGPVVGLTATT